MRYFSHLNTATGLIQEYGGQEPLNHFLKKFFSQHKKFGSKDRRRIGHLCYVFYRVGRAVRAGFPHRDAEMIGQIIVAGLFLCNQEPDELLEVMKPEWNERIALTISQKTDILNQDGAIARLELHQLFPATDELSEGIDKVELIFSHLQQPDLFIRIRPGYHEIVIQKLQQQASLYEFIAGSTVRLPNGYKVDDIFEVDKEVVVQDLSSQRIGEFLPYPDYRSVPYVWDCCAGSGGKSIMAKDILGDIDLTVSDIRESIISNLKKRFAIAGINNYESSITDLSKTHSPLTIHHPPFDLIIADLPCTGSGTWSRTPEQLYFFESSSIKKYSQLQKKIAANVMPHLKDTGKLLYTTCSVFEKENENIIRFILEQFPLKVEKMELLKGYDKKADTMFAALLSRL